MIYLGEIAKGLSLLDEAMVSVEAREIPPMAVGDAYCTVIDAVPRIVRHSAMRTVDRYHSRAGATLNTASSSTTATASSTARTLLMLHGAWSDGLSVATGCVHRTQRTDECADARRSSLLEAEFHRLRGEFAMAERAYERANCVRMPTPARHGSASPCAGPR